MFFWCGQRDIDDVSLISMKRGENRRGEKKKTPGRGRDFVSLFFSLSPSPSLYPYLCTSVSPSGTTPPPTSGLFIQSV